MAKPTRRRVGYIIPPAKPAAGHRLGVNGLAVDVDRSILYSAGRDGLICTWDLDLDLKTTFNNDASSPISPTRVTGQTQQEHVGGATRHQSQVQAHTNWINDLILTQSGHALCTASSDNSVKVFRPHALDGSGPQTLGYHSDYVRALAAPSKHTQWVAAGGLDRKITLWDLAGAGKSLDIPITAEDENAAKGSVYALAANPYLLVSGGPESVVKVWDARAGKRIKTFRGHTDNIRSVLISQSGDTVISASSDQTVRVWSMRGGGCLNNLTMHNDSVWSLYSDRPDLSVFYSGDRSGVVAKTDARSRESIEDGLCVALCHEQEGIVRIVSAGDYVWTTTANSTINRWADVDTSMQVDFPEHLRPLKLSAASRSRFSVASQQQQPQPHSPSFSTSEKIPLASVLRLSATASFPPTMTRERHRMSMYSHHRKTSAAVTIDPVELGTTAVRDLPLESIQGSDGLIKLRSLPDRKRVLTLDSSGEVILWDLIHCSPVMKFGMRHLDEVHNEVLQKFPLPAAAEWCKIDVNIGILYCTLDERRCFDAEMYYDCLPDLKELSAKEDQRVNYGKWILRYLFASLIDHEIKEDDLFIKKFETERASKKGAGLSLNIPSGTTEGTFMPLSASAQTPNPGMPGYRSLMTPGLQIGVAPAILNVPSPVDHTKHSMAGQASPSVGGQTSAEAQEDYFSQQRPRSSNESETEWPKSGLEESSSNPLSSPSLDDKSKENASKRWRMFGNRKQPKTPTAEQPKPPAPALNTPRPAADPSSALLTEELKQAEEYEGTMRATIAKIRMSYGSNSRAGSTIKSGIMPALASETPHLKLPSGIIVVIQEEYAEFAGTKDAYESIVTQTGRHAAQLEVVAPEWLGDVLLLNHFPPGLNAQKVTFTLRSYDSSLPEVVNESDTDTDRLNANRLLRARKVLTYIADRLEPSCKPSNAEALRAEDYLDLYCQDRIVPPQMTLADIKTEFKCPSDLYLAYRLKMQPQASATA